MTRTLHGREITTLEELSEYDNFGPHAFDPDAEFKFDSHAALFMTEGEYEGYIGYQELGTVIGNRRERFFRTTFTKVPGNLFSAAIVAHSDVADAMQDIFNAMGTDRGTEAGVKYGLAQGHFAFLMATIKNTPNLNREVVYSKISLLSDEAADPSANSVN